MKYLNPENHKLINDSLSERSMDKRKSIQHRGFAAVFELMSRAGLRTEEVMSMRINQIDLHTFKVDIKSAKGSSNRSIPLPQNYLRSIAILAIENALRPDEYVLQIIWPHYNNTCHRTYKKYLQNEWSKFRFHILGEGFTKYTLHSLRHSFAVRILEQTKDIMKVKTALGHKSLSSTQVYIEALYEQDMSEDILRSIP